MTVPFTMCATFDVSTRGPSFVDSDEQYVRVGTPQDQALNLAIEMFILLLKSCCSLLQNIDFEARNTQDGLSVPLRQFLPAVKVFADWMTHHADLWQASSIRYLHFIGVSSGFQVHVGGWSLSSNLV